PKGLQTLEQPDPRGISPQSAAFRLKSALQLGGIVDRIQRVQFECLVLQQLFLVIVHGGLLFVLKAVAD
ncbi:hypothetical protein, partial [Pseudomonas sp. PA-3-10C]|uniref:hypothetical protein n=1 Tax=Pseudomonas sp. PA-3-10C TaxID=2665471 RepID=UPI001F1F45D8